MANGHIPKDVLYGKCVIGTRTIGRPSLCKRDMKMAGININNWEAVACDRETWKSVVKTVKTCGEGRRWTHQAEKGLT